MEFNSIFPNPTIHPPKPLSFKGEVGCETYKIDENTIGMRPKWISVKDSFPTHMQEIKFKGKFPFECAGFF